MAEQLVASLAEPFDPSKYTDEYRANLMKIIRAKMKGKKITVPEPEEDTQDTKVVDLMARLQASLEQGEARRGGSVRARKKTAAASEKPADEKPAKRSRRRSA